MDYQIESWRVLQYAQNVYNLSQQRGSRLASLVRGETFNGKAEFFDRLGLATAQAKSGRSSDTPNLSIAHTRRMLTTLTYEWGTLIDKKDKVLQIHSPENEYSVAAQNALGRKMDDVLIEAALGTAKTGEDGSGSQTLGNGQKVASVASSALDYANLQLLRKAKRLMDAAEVQGQRYIVHGADFLEQLLAVTQVTSSDYNSVKALVAGEIDTFMGFKFIHSERLPLASVHDTATFKWDSTTGLYNASGTTIAGTDKCAIAMVGDGIILGKNPIAIARVGERADKSYDNQVYTAMDFGGVRMEEEKVVQLIYKAS